VLYVDPRIASSPAPLTQQPAAPAKSPAALPAPLALVGKLKQYSWGSVLGVAATGAAAVFEPTFHEKPWLDLPLALFCIGLGILLERAVNYTVGRDIDSIIELAAARRDADRRLGLLRSYERKGVINYPAAHKLAFGIAKRTVLGPPKPGKPRGPYRKRQKPADLPIDPVRPMDPPRPQQPTA
jgi:hypothetical protein